jgi:sugar lactone lactonase YvrE
MLPDAKVSNGLGWSPDNKIMYYCDTNYRTIRAFDFDAVTGGIENERVLISVPDEPGEGGPDGLTVDSEGFIWSARWGGWKIVRYDPDGKVEREVKLPAARITSAIFGGPDLDKLYITSARIDLSEADLISQPHAGSVFVFEPGVKGLPEAAYKG